MAIKMDIEGASTGFIPYSVDSSGHGAAQMASELTSGRRLAGLLILAAGLLPRGSALSRGVQVKNGNFTTLSLTTLETWAICNCLYVFGKNIFDCSATLSLLLFYPLAYQKVHSKRSPLAYVPGFPSTSVS